MIMQDLKFMETQRIRRRAHLSAVGLSIAVLTGLLCVMALVPAKWLIVGCVYLIAAIPVASFAGHFIRWGMR